MTYCQVFSFIVVVVCIQLNKMLLLKIVIDRITPYFFLIPSQLELTFFGHELKLCSENSVTTMITVNVV